MCLPVSVHQNNPQGADLPSTDVVQMVAEQALSLPLLESKEAEGEQETSKEVKPQPDPPGKLVVPIRNLESYDSDWFKLDLVGEQVT